MRLNIAVLDDYVGVSQTVADWEPLKARANVAVFGKPLSVPEEAAGNSPTSISSALCGSACRYRHRSSSAFRVSNTSS